MTDRDDKPNNVIPIRGRPESYVARQGVAVEVAIKRLEGDGTEVVYIPTPGPEWTGWVFTPAEARYLAQCLLEQADAVEARKS